MATELTSEGTTTSSPFYFYTSRKGLRSGTSAYGLFNTTPSFITNTTLRIAAIFSSGSPLTATTSAIFVASIVLSRSSIVVVDNCRCLRRTQETTKFRLTRRNQAAPAGPIASAAPIAQALDLARAAAYERIGLPCRRVAI